jgi:hypothetical protein
MTIRPDRVRSLCLGSMAASGVDCWRDALHEASEVNHFNGAYNSAYNGASYRLRCMRSSEQYRVKQHTLLRHQRPYGMMFSSARRLVRVRQTLWAMETLY